MINEDRVTKSQSDQECTLFRRLQTSPRIIVRPGAPNVRITPDAAALLLQSCYREASKEHMPSPIAVETSPRKALRRVPINSSVNDGDGIKGNLKVKEAIQPKRDISMVRETEDSASVENDTAFRTEHIRISTAGLRRLAMERLPASSALRDVLLAESENLTVEEFLAKLDIWLLLFRKDVGG